MKNSILLIVILFIGFSFSCKKNTRSVELKTINHLKDTIIFKENFIAKSFDFPVGKPDAKGYYNAQKFKKNNHLGDDWNATSGGNSDLGDPIYAIANGYVTTAENFAGGWGNVIRIKHKLPNGKTVESLYAHCHKIIIKPNQWVKKGQQIATIGNANNRYYAHLHLEIRDDITLPLGRGYSEDNKGYLDPTKFIKSHR